mgnify:CR=1 FL=1
MEHIVKTYILLLFSLLVSSIGYAPIEDTNKENKSKI